MNPDAQDPLAWRLIDWLIAAVSALLTLGLGIVGFFQRTMYARVSRLEAAQSAIAVLAERVSQLASSIEHMATLQQSQYSENTDLIREEQERTRRWREDVMSPALQRLVENHGRMDERIQALESRRSRKR